MKFDRFDSDTRDLFEDFGLEPEAEDVADTEIEAVKPVEGAERVDEPVDGEPPVRAEVLLEADSEPEPGPGPEPEPEPAVALRSAERAAPVDDEPLVPKAYYSIGEVCELTGLKAHVLRYWETQFRALNPQKNSAGNRVYKPDDIELILFVKTLLYDQKFTIDGARRRLQELRHEGELEEERGSVVQPEFWAAIKDELLALRRVLTPEEGQASREGHETEMDWD